MSSPQVNGGPQDASELSEERVGLPARSLVRLTETRPDGRRLTRYRRDRDEA